MTHQVHKIDNPEENRLQNKVWVGVGILGMSLTFLDLEPERIPFLGPVPGEASGRVTKRDPEVDVGYSRRERRGTLEEGKHERSFGETSSGTVFLAACDGAYQRWRRPR